MYGAQAPIRMYGAQAPICSDVAYFGLTATGRFTKSAPDPEADDC
jgi:hypothetical protein